MYMFSESSWLGLTMRRSSWRRAWSHSKKGKFFHCWEEFSLKYAWKLIFLPFREEVWTQCNDFGSIHTQVKSTDEDTEINALANEDTEVKVKVEKLLKAGSEQRINLERIPRGKKRTSLRKRIRRCATYVRTEIPPKKQKKLAIQECSKYKMKTRDSVTIVQVNWN